MWLINLTRFLRCLQRLLEEVRCQCVLQVQIIDSHMSLLTVPYRYPKSNMLFQEASKRNMDTFCQVAEDLASRRLPGFTTSGRNSGYPIPQCSACSKPRRSIREFTHIREIHLHQHCSTRSKGSTRCVAGCARPRQEKRLISSC